MKTYSINTRDTETSPAWMDLCVKAKPATQDSGNQRYTVTVQDDDALAFETAANNDYDTISYEEI